MVKCPRCGKTLKTKSGLADHMRALHSNGKKKNGNGGSKRGNGNGVTNPIQKSNAYKGIQSTGKLHRPMVNAVSTLRGTDYLGKMETVVDTSVAADSIVFHKYISPSEYPGTRLKSLSELWERYRFRQFTIRFVPAVPTTLGCQMLVYQDTDPQDDPTSILDPEALIRQATAQTGAQQWNFNEPQAIDLAQRKDDQWYYTGKLRTGEGKSNARFSRQGAIYLIQVTNVVDLNGKAVTDPIQAGTLYVDWVCDFQTPQIEPEAVASLTHAEFTVGSLDSSLTNSSGWASGPYYTIKVGEGPVFIHAPQYVGDTLSENSRKWGMVINDDTHVETLEGEPGIHYISFSDKEVGSSQTAVTTYAKIIELRANRTYRFCAYILNDADQEKNETLQSVRLQAHYNNGESEAPVVNGPHAWPTATAQQVGGGDDVDGFQAFFSKVNVNIHPSTVRQVPASVKL